VLLLSVDCHQNHLSLLCRQNGVASVYVAENSLKNRLMIASTEVSNPVNLLRRGAWEVSQEWKARRAIAIADGLQCNGTPTYERYKSINTRSMIFFDTRTTAADLASEMDIERRFAERRRVKTLRLCFSGRLIAMKGVDHLIDVAVALRELGRKFQLTICGAGNLEGALRDRIRNEQLCEQVHLAGNLDFSTELLPFMRRNVDVFVSCHRQGDPSCTYLETLASAVPIAGYGNEAWKGLVRVSGCGWATPMNQPKVLAECLASLSDQEIEVQSRRSVEFARHHTFEEEFKKRVVHLHSLATVNARASR
jgi:colanic acid/amylovoran biosynthesis glycosyltransferase